MSLLRGAEAINSIGQGIKGVFGEIFSPISKGYKYATSDGAKSFEGFAKDMWGGEKGQLTHFSAFGKDWNGGEIAKTVAGLGIGYRFLSGGGVYRDKDGNTDLAGIPFV